MPMNYSESLTVVGYDTAGTSNGEREIGPQRERSSFGALLCFRAPQKQVVELANEPICT